MIPSSKRLPPPIVAHDHQPRVDADADAATVAEVRLDGRDDRARRRDAAIGVVGQRLGRAEHAEHAVAEEVPHAPAVLLEHRDDDPEELVQQRDRLARGHPSANGVKSRMSTNSTVTSASSPFTTPSATTATRARAGPCRATTPRRSSAQRVEVELVAQPQPERLERPASRRSGGGRSVGPHAAWMRARAGRKSAATASVETATATGAADREPDQQHQREVDGAERDGQRAVDQRAVDHDVESNRRCRRIAHAGRDRDQREQQDAVGAAGAQQEQRGTASITAATV